jgi:hypothetical protein
MTQFELPLPIPLDKPKQEVENLESLSLEDLQTRYQSIVGVNPKARAFDRETLIAGIQNPEAEKNRIAEIDRASDREDIDRTYFRK